MKWKRKTSMKMQMIKQALTSKSARNSNACASNTKRHLTSRNNAISWILWRNVLNTRTWLLNVKCTRRPRKITRTSRMSRKALKCPPYRIPNCGC